MAVNPSPLGREEFDALLARLDSDRDRAAAGYESLRERLLRFFEWEGAVEAEELADEALTRLARRVAGGEAIQNLPAFAAGIARLIALEHRRSVRRRELIVLPEPKEDRSRADECLERCLQELPPDGRSLILRYYDGDAGARIRNRSRLAAELGISLNSLRNRALRLRDRLEKCLNDCLERDESRRSDTQG
jgi:DNA-directed RNA polymerase specialized sigma24 family protein